MAEKFNILSISGKGKGFKIFRSEAYKEHEKPPMAQMFWRFRWMFAVWLLTVLAFGVAFAGEHLWRYGWSPATYQWMKVYFSNMIYSGGLSIFAEIPAWFTRMVMRPDIPAVAPFLPLIAYYMLTQTEFIKEFNPHGKDKYDEASSRKANEEDIKKMGLLNGFITVLGFWKKKPLMLNECLSTLSLAPPGTGKTTALVIPTIFGCDTVSMIINDPKPELDDLTSGYRATIGPVFIMNWAGQDDPDRGIYYPSWNPLSPEHVPFLQEKRDLYIDTICATLIADKASSTADPHWTQTGREALAGLVHFMVSKIERAKWNDYFKARLDSGTFDATDAALLDERYAMMQDPNAEAARHMLRAGQLTSMSYVHVGTWSLIPPSWIGKEASLSMILDWLTTSQIRIAEELENRRKQGDQMVMMADPIKDMFLGAVDEAQQYGYAQRSISALTTLANTPDRERGSILSTVNAGLNIFRNAAVRNRTSHSDFHFSDLRGIKNQKTGKWEPVSVYLSINLVDAEALNPITGIFIELMSSWLLANKPEAMHAGAQLGPTPVLFVLDEMPKMQKLQAVIQGPDVGRGQQVSYLVIGQDIAQIREKYGADAAATIMSTTAAKVIFRQNDWETAEKFSRLMGKKITKEDKTNEKGETEEKTKDPVDLYTPMDILKLDEKKQIVILQGFYNRPMELDQVRYYTDDGMNAKRAMGKASPLPEYLVPAHHAAMGYPGAPNFYDTVAKKTKKLAVSS